jgi:hypothetical protein
MSAWQELTKLALLGTEKVPLQLQLLPQPIQQQLASADPTDREALFLQAAILVRLYDRAGQKAPALDVPNLSLAPDETQPFIPPQYQNLLRRLLEKNNCRPDLLGLFLKKIVAKNCVLPHEFLVEFLNAVCDKKFENCHAAAQKVLGERGRWLAKCNVHWADFDLGKPDLDWEVLSDKQIQELLVKIGFSPYFIASTTNF